MPTGKLQVIPLGGLGEFGMNSMAIRYNDDIIVIDAGMMFPDSELLGVDVVTPDFSYLKDHREMVRGLILTHGHEDRRRALPFIASQHADLRHAIYPGDGLPAAGRTSPAQAGADESDGCRRQV